MSDFLELAKYDAYEIQDGINTTFKNYLFPNIHRNNYKKRYLKISWITLKIISLRITNFSYFCLE